MILCYNCRTPTTNTSELRGEPFCETCAARELSRVVGDG